MQTTNSTLAPLSRPAASSVAVAAPHDVWLHRIALATCCVTFPLIFMGGLVTSHHAGMSVPDWPNSYGYNMFLFPPSKWVGGILYEHVHRLMATVVGLLSIALAAWAWRGSIARPLRQMGLRWLDHAADFPSNRPQPHRHLALLVLGAVVAQGVLGGLRVVLVNLDLAVIHGCVAQAFFCLTAYVVLATSRSWSIPPTASVAAAGARLSTLGVVTVAAIFLQLILGAAMRHFGAGLAIPDLPRAYGRWLPPMTDDALDAANRLRAFKLNLDPVTLHQIWLHFAHRVGAVVVSTLLITLITLALRARARMFVAPAIFLALLLAAQVTLGVLTVYLRKPADVASSHVAVGALVLMMSFVLAIRALRVR